MITCTQDVVVGDRVELHPATDAWMMGDRFGDVIKVGTKLVHVRMDTSGKVRKLAPDLVTYQGKANCPTCGARYLEHLGYRVHMRVDCKGWS